MQFFLQGKLLGTEDFLREPDSTAGTSGRALYLSLLSEVMPRALLATLGLAPELLGFSGGGRFLLVLPGESIEAANEFLRNAGAKLSALSGGLLRLLWSSTENLGDWSVVRKRLNEPLDKLVQTPLAGGFQPLAAAPVEVDFGGLYLTPFPAAKRVGWDAESVTMVVLDGGAWTWVLSMDPAIDTVSVAAHFARDEHSENPASPEQLGNRAQGRAVWGVLRGDVDNFGVRLRRAQTIEEHIQFSVFFKQFFAGELQVACSMGEFFRKVSILYTGADTFAVYGAWDALIPLAREIERLFHKSVDEFLKDLPGVEGKTISMALAFAPDREAPLWGVYAEAGRILDSAKSLGKDSVAVFGHTLEWKQLNEAVDLKTVMNRLIRDFGCAPDFLGQLSAFFRESAGDQTLRLNRAKADRFDRPWRFYRRLSHLLEASTRTREFQKARSTFFNEFLGKNQAHVKLRPSSRVALEWARFMQEAE